MTWDKTRAEFDQFAQTYELLLGEDKAKAPLNAFYTAALDRLKPRTVLDCACGPGWTAIALAKAGYAVTASDISREMIGLAQANAAWAGVRLTFLVSAWNDLPSATSQTFDFVMCQGNAIGHCQGAKAMLESLRALRAVTREGGHLALDTRSWEWFRSQCAPYWPGKIREDERGRHTIIHAATIPPRWPQPHIIETIDICEHAGALSVAAYPTTFYAFKVKQIIQRLEQAGFADVATDYQEGMAQYGVLSRAAPP